MARTTFATNAPTVTEKCRSQGHSWKTSHFEARAVAERISPAMRGIRMKNVDASRVPGSLSSNEGNEE